MENLNAETVKKALEVCSKQYKDDTCDKCPDCIYRNLGCDCVLQAITDALALINSQEQKIKELDEDNEYLKTQVTATEARYESRKESDLEEVLELRLKVEELTEENERLRADKDYWEKRAKESESEYDQAVKRGYNFGTVDSVRSFAERLKADAVTIRDHTGKLGVVVGVGNIDDVAREMLEGENEN